MACSSSVATSDPTKKLVVPLTVSGPTSFFVGSDVATEEEQAIPLAAEDLAVHLVSQLSEGW